MKHTRGWRRFQHEWHWGKGKPTRPDIGRWSGGVDLSGVNRPYLTWSGEGDDWAYIAIGFGSPGSDPVLRLEVDLEGTRAGRWLAWACWKGRVAQGLGSVKRQEAREARDTDPHGAQP